MEKVILGLVGALALSSVAHADVQAQKQFCAYSTKSIVQTIDDIPLFKTYNLTVVDSNKATLIRFDAAKNVLYCKIDVVFSNTKTEEFGAKFFNSKFNHNQIMIIVKPIQDMFTHIPQ